MRRFMIGAALLAAATGASAQVLTDSFTYPDGPTIGTWVEAKGNWNTVSNQAEAEQVFSWQYLTHPSAMYKDVACQCVVTYNAASTQALQFGGVAIRATGAATDTNLIMCKFQDNDSSGDFDRLYIYDRPGTSTWADPTTPSKQGLVRLLAIDTRIVCQLDTDGDGAWDLVINHTSSQAAASGPVGLSGFGGALLDDFKLFNAVLLPDTANPPANPGTTQQYVMRGNPGDSFQAALSLGNSGIPLGAAGTIPLSLDPLLQTSLNFRAFAGTLDANGDGSFTFFIPSIPALVGFRYYAAFVTINAGITGISNDHQVTII